ncbi:hypothetical protein FRC11_002275, partial [Ceratobasidium sp. 423]
IFGSIKDKTDITTTGEKLAIQGYLLSEDHLKQFALLQLLSEDYNEAQAQAQAKKKVLAFWMYIDSQIFWYQKFSATECADIMKDILCKDQKTYPDLTGQAHWFPPAN